MRTITRIACLALFMLAGAVSVAQRPGNTAAAILPPPRFNAMAVLTGIASSAGREAFGLGPHAYLSTLRYGDAGGVFPRSLGAGVRTERVWALTFVDRRASADRRTTRSPSICPLTLIALSALDGTQLGRICRRSLPKYLAAQPAPRFGVTGILNDLRCRCAKDGPTPYRFDFGRHAYLAVLRYGRIRDLFPGNPIGKPVQDLRIWDLVFLNPQVAVDQKLAGNRGWAVCARSTVSLRASDGTDWAAACYPQR